mmetsp:Transcript_11101/g.19342  ORF Transcript_11101/g.19342 Transcript_11101/m.19342 type:complete len:211 (+) Transcript_11101:1477-2109(+)
MLLHHISVGVEVHLVPTGAYGRTMQWQQRCMCVRLCRYQGNLGVVCWMASVLLSISVCKKGGDQRSREKTVWKEGCCLPLDVRTRLCVMLVEHMLDGQHTAMNSKIEKLVSQCVLLIICCLLVPQHLLTFTCYPRMYLLLLWYVVYVCDVLISVWKASIPLYTLPVQEQEDQRKQISCVGQDECTSTVRAQALDSWSRLGRTSNGDVGFG